MKKNTINLFIVDDDKLMVATLKQFLQNRFQNDINVFTFYDGESCLESVNKETDVVILDYNMTGKNGLDVLKSIKMINPKTEVIMLSGNEDMATAISLFRAGASDYVLKGEGSWKKLSKLVYHIVTAPIRIVVREFGVSKYMAIFMLTFVLMGLLVVAALQFMKP
ncbi:MAG: response regulator [Bacteroidetes bacterium]|nr:response regulator [Bacteroidota bacterium]